MDSLPSVSSPRSSSVPASSPSPPSAPTDDDIEAVIQLATSSRLSPDGRQGPLRDTRTQLFVGNLPYRVRWQDLKDLFRKAGTVLRADVSLGPDNRSRGFGTVLLATAEDASRAVDMFNGYSWQTRILEVRPDRLPPDFDSALSVSGLAAGSVSLSLGSVHFSGSPLHAQMMPVTSSMQEEYNSVMASGSSNNGGRNLFVGNLPFHCQWQDLKDLFRQAGTIVRADVALGPDGRSRGFGTVVFATEVDADHAVNMFNGYEYNGRPLKVHHDKFSPSSGSTSPPALPSAPSFRPGSSLGGQIMNPPGYIRLPAGYMFDFGPPSGPTSPFDLYPPQPPVQSSMSQLTSQSQSQSQSQSLSHHTVDSLKASIASASISGNSFSPDQRTSSPSSSLRGSRSRLQSQLQSASHSHNHPAHPGPISLPPPLQAASFPLIPSHNLSPHGVSMSMSPPISMSPHHHPAHQHQQQHQMTPHGLPPITPSMPPFTFLPQLSPHAPHPQAHNHGPTTPTLATPNGMHHIHHVISPFSPVLTMSPGAFWGRPGGGANPFINPAVGAPVHGSPGGFFDMALAMGMGMGESVSPRDEPAGYFPPVDSGYFPPMGPGYALGSEGVANEILKDRTTALGVEDNGVHSPEDDIAEGPASGSASSAETLDGGETGMEKQDEDGAAEMGKGENEAEGLDGSAIGGHAPVRTSSLSSSFKFRRPLTAARSGSDPVPGTHDGRAPAPKGESR